MTECTCIPLVKAPEEIAEGGHLCRASDQECPSKDAKTLRDLPVQTESFDVAVRRANAPHSRVRHLPNQGPAALLSDFADLEFFLGERE
jgi:hypothetical protein